METRAREARDFFDFVAHSSNLNTSKLWYLDQEIFFRDCAVDTFTERGCQLTEGNLPTYKPWMSSPLHSFVELTNSIIVTVNKNESEAILVEQFKRTLKELRAVGKKKKTPQLDLYEWGDCGLLAYADLQIWSLVEFLLQEGNKQEPLPNNVLRDLILPPHARADHRVGSVA